MMKPYKKIDAHSLSEEKFEVKPYIKDLTYNDAVVRFRLRGRTCKTIKTHFKSDVKFSKDLWRCWECSFLDNSFHILHQCPHYDEMRRMFNLEDEEQVVKFFVKVIEEREEKRNKEEE